MVVYKTKEEEKSLKFIIICNHAIKLGRWRWLEHVKRREEGKLGEEMHGYGD